MRSALFAIVVIVLALGAFAAYSAAFIVSQTEQALVLEFGKPKRVIKEPGLYFKYPLVQTVTVYDKRILALDSKPQEVIAADQKRLVVDAFARFRITDPLLFYQAVTNETVARSRLSSTLDASLRRVLGAADFQTVVRDQRDVMMERINEDVNDQAKEFGIEVVDVRLKRVDLPQANSEAIYRRMQTERQQEAAEIRAQGKEAAQRIRSEADRKATIIKAEAERDAQILRGEGDAQRTKIFADAFGRDEDFFAFYRSMQAYEKGIKADDTRMVLSPSSPFFNYFSSPYGAGSDQQTAGSDEPTPTPAGTVEANEIDEDAPGPRAAATR
ncbi:protease modulator HflC [Dichotomicrobium thermohalophilum]|uniref:Protein HflC n=1 Tax=Dichotomicrobium thermohalophilum TaxID=933063 RepID=A0A397PE36_9HYPH|nr:protease modulator HflC [Dichotomicrobium thermohalophilum]RIA47776.1 protease FtsH subunit HflC [Dichotomicrobium thermohalophilum]